MLFAFPQPLFHRSSSLDFPFRRHVRVTRDSGRELLPMRSTCPIHVHLLITPYWLAGGLSVRSPAHFFIGHKHRPTWAGTCAERYQVSQFVILHHSQRYSNTGSIIHYCCHYYSGDFKSSDRLYFTILRSIHFLQSKLSTTQWHKGKGKCSA